MKFENKALETSFEIPDRLTTRQRLAYKTAVGLSGDDNIFTRAWLGVRVLAQNWQSAHIPDPLTLDLDDDENSDAVSDIIIWATGEVMANIRPGGGDTPKN